MTVAARKPMSRVEFLDWVEGQEARFEFDGAAPVAMTGGTVAHHRLQRRLMRSLGERLDGGPCEPFGPEAAIATVGEAVRFPDAVVGCSPLAPAARVIDRPVVVFEILSPSSARVDRIIKLREYGAVASIAQYVIVEQDSVGVTNCLRGPGDGWITHALVDGDVLALPALGVSLPVSELYQDVAFALDA